MECAGRALEFWSYQMLQERVYQEHMAKSLSDENNGLNNELDRIIHDANTEFAVIQDKLSALQLEHETLQRKNHDLMEAYREKARKSTKTQELYDRLKKRTLLSQVQNAASASVEQSYQRSPLSDTVAALAGKLDNNVSRNHTAFQAPRGPPVMDHRPQFPYSNMPPMQANAARNMDQQGRSQYGNGWDSNLAQD
ncbi:MAG: hypothetical protein M1814_006150 [Vezdaea aestivalis]|nr:MAG: hypothetical protein M1814_006150 [Vezdaea aestivalis]